MNALGQFGPEMMVQLPADIGGIVRHATDLDGDGDQDLLVRDSYLIYSLKNLDGQGDFGQLDTLLAESWLTQSKSSIGDLDSDGDMDVICFRGDVDQLLWLENDGTGSFGSTQALTDEGVFFFIEEQHNYLKLICADVTGSPEPDVVVGNEGVIYWFENDGGTLQPKDSLVHCLYNGWPYQLLIGDVDLDGDQDHVTNCGGIWRVGLNPGNGSAWTSAVYPGAIQDQWGSQPYGAQLIDVDDDGDLDLLDAMYGIGWIQNTLVESGTWGGVAHDIALASTEGAGWAEHLGCGPGISLLWCNWPYMGPVYCSTYDASTASFTTSAITDLHSVGDGRLLFSDLNGDGRKDIVTSQNDTIRWYANELAVATLELSLDTLLDCSAPFALSGGTPEGGSFFIDGSAEPDTELDPAHWGPGLHTITYIHTDPMNGCSTQATDELHVDCQTGMAMPSRTGLTIWPNPVDDHTTLTFAGTAHPIVLTDAIGRIITIWGPISSPSHLDLSNVSAGSYVLRAGTSVVRLVVR